MFNATAKVAFAPWFYGQKGGLVRKDRQANVGTGVKELLSQGDGMRIGHNNNSISIEKVPNELGPAWHLEAMVIGTGWMFAGMHDHVVVASSADTAREIADFAAFKVQRFEVALADGGWFRLTRNASGAILVQYRLGRSQAGVALEGEIVLETELSEKICRELSALL